MSKIDELIERLCPDGVEYKTLGEVVELLDSRRKPVRKDNRKAGSYPYYGANGILDYIDDYLFDGVFLLVGEDGSVITPDKKPILNWAVGKIWVNNHAHVLHEKADRAILRYIYFALQTVNIFDLVKGVPPKLNQANLKSISIPVPPLEVQEEIVRVLDSFAELEAELEAELKAELKRRKAQYTYYRDKLLSLEGLKSLSGEEIPICMLGDLISNLRTGLNPRKNFKLNTPDAKNNYVTVRELSGMEIKVTNKTDKVNDAGLELINNRAHLTSGDVLFSGTGTIGNTALVRENPKDWGIKEGVYAITPKPELLNAKFLIYMMHTTYLVAWCSSVKSGGTVQSISMAKLKTMPIFLPSLDVQKRIVAILDKFDALVNDLTSGLPAEIEARRKQYEYYRDKLLSFPVKES